MPRRRSTYVQSRLRRLRRRRIALVILVLLISLAALLDRLGVFGYTGNDWETFDQQPFIVVQVLDGDTVDIAQHPGASTTRVRLVGIDAPEMNYRSDGPPDHWAQQSTDYLRARTGDQTIILRLEQTQTRDRYGRLLAYLYLDEENLNLSIVRDGHAYADRRFNHSFRPQFEQAENEARRRTRGLWQDVTEDRMPPWRQQWLQQRSSAGPYNSARHVILSEAALSLSKGHAAEGSPTLHDVKDASPLPPLTAFQREICLLPHGSHILRTNSKGRSPSTHDRAEPQQSTPLRSHWPHPAPRR